MSVAHILLMFFNFLTFFLLFSGKLQFYILEWVHCHLINACSALLEYFSMLLAFMMFHKKVIFDVRSCFIDAMEFVWILRSEIQSNFPVYWLRDTMLLQRCAAFLCKIHFEIIEEHFHIFTFSKDLQEWYTKFALGNKK